MHTNQHMVQEGDTWGEIASAYGISSEELITANPQRGEEEPLLQGELLAIPARLARRYAVQSGDTIAHIARKFGCPADRILAMNAGQDRDAILEEGLTIELPPTSNLSIVSAFTAYTPIQLAKDLRRLKQSFPFIEVKTIGRSVMGKPIYAARIGEGEQRWQLNAAMHANEWITSLLAMRFLEDYGRACRRKGLIGGKEAATLFSKSTLWVVPMLNPDGVELVQEGLALPAQSQHPYHKELLEWNRGSSSFRRWKANIRGVDLNDQFPACWEEEKRRRGVTGPGPRDYGGASPLSEPEAAALADFTASTDFHAAIALHTQGEEIYWNYRDLEPQVSKQWAERLGQASGYRAVALTDSDAGFKDWFIQTYRRPGFTVEAGFGRNPLPLADFPEIYEDWVKLMAEALDLTT